MNQQRQRRFKSSQEAREALAIAKEKGQKVPDEDDLFDSNCITPGTEFMARLSDSIKYFVRAKIRDDVSWRQVKVIFSGHEVRYNLMDFSLVAILTKVNLTSFVVFKGTW